MRGRGLDGVRLGTALARGRGAPIGPRWRACATARAGRRASPRRCSPELEERLGAARRRDRLGPTPDRRGDRACRIRRSGRCCSEHGCSRRRKPPREAAEPVRVAVPGRSAAHGHQALRALRRAQATPSPATAPGAAREKRAQVGHEFAHAIIDDHTRLAYSELHPDERADTVVAFTQRALAWYARRGITAKRVMTDNAWNYTKLRSASENCSPPTTIEAPHDQAAPTADKRQDRTLPPDDGPRVGLRPDLPLKHAPRRTPCHTGSTTTTSTALTAHIGNRPPISRVRNL